MYSKFFTPGGFDSCPDLVLSDMDLEIPLKFLQKFVSWAKLI